MWIAVKITKENEIFAVIYQLKQLRRRPEKNSGSNGIWTHDLCDSGANALPLSYEATGSWSSASSIYTHCITRTSIAISSTHFLKDF